MVPPRRSARFCKLEEETSHEKSREPTNVADIEEKNITEPHEKGSKESRDETEKPEPEPKEMTDMHSELIENGGEEKEEEQKEEQEEEQKEEKHKEPEQEQEQKEEKHKEPEQEQEQKEEPEQEQGKHKEQEQEHDDETAVPVKLHGGNPDRFADVLHTCVRSAQLTPGRSLEYLPLCHNTLRAVAPEDVQAFQMTQPAAHRALETNMAQVMTHLHEKHGYRSVGLYVALLIQNIDLMDTSQDALAQGKSGEVCQRLSAVVKQSLQAREARMQRVPKWTIVTMSVLGGLLAICVIFILTFVGLLCF